MSEIDVRDPDPEEPSPGGDSATPASSSVEGEPEAPYRNLLVPLIVVPAAIVLALVLVFALFGLIAGDPASPQENLDKLIHGGTNEREQAAFGLVLQAMEVWQAREAGREPEWVIDESFLPPVRSAWERTDERDYQQRYVLAGLMGLLEDPLACEHMLELLDIPPSEDSEGHMRAFVIRSLGQLGDPAAAARVASFTQDEDSYLRQVAAYALHSLDASESREALRELLVEPDLALRGMAASSLAYLGEADGVGVLRELLDLAPYERERELYAGRWRSGEDVRVSRVSGLHGLWRLGRAEDHELIVELSTEEPDIEVRAIALEALEHWDAGPSWRQPEASGGSEE